MSMCCSHLEMFTDQSPDSYRIEFNRLFSLTEKQMLKNRKWMGNSRIVFCVSPSARACFVSARSETNVEIYQYISIYHMVKLVFSFIMSEHRYLDVGIYRRTYYTHIHYTDSIVLCNQKLIESCLRIETSIFLLTKTNQNQTVHYNRIIFNITVGMKHRVACPSLNKAQKLLWLQTHFPTESWKSSRINCRYELMNQLKWS